MFSRNDWAGMSDDQKVLSLQGVETQEAVNQGRPVATVVSEDMPSQYSGTYTPDDNTIHINSEDIHADRPDEALDTCYRGGRHAYQHNEAANPEVADSPEYANQCRNGLPEYGGNYITHEQDPEGYENQFVEADARGYAQGKMNDYDQNEGRYHSGLYGDNQDQSQSPNAEQNSNNAQVAPQAAQAQQGDVGQQQQSPESSPDNNESEYSGYSY